MSYVIKLSNALGLWLDDERSPPKFGSWFWATTAHAAIQALQTQEFVTISLDHDLGDPENGEGYDVLLFIEHKVRAEGWRPPHMLLHTANPVAQQRMRAAIDAIRAVVGR